MPFFREKGQSAEEEDEDDDSFVIELLNARKGYNQNGIVEEKSFTDEVARAFEKSEANGTDGGFSVWGDGGKYPCAAEAAGVDVGSMLEAGVDAKQLWEFVSNYRKEEGHRLGLLNEQNLKFATSQVLRHGVKANTEAADTRSGGTGPALGSVDGKKRNGVSHLTAGRQPPPTWKGAPRYNEQQLSPNQREQEEDQPARRGVQRWRVDQPTAPTVASAGLFGKEDRAETARLCDELLRWSSALEGAEKQGSENGTSTKAESDDEEKGDALLLGADNGHRRPRPSHAHVPAGSNRAHPRQLSDTKAKYRRDRNSSLDETSESGPCLEESGEGHASPPGRNGAAMRENATGIAHNRPTPSYALPTKHFKTVDRDRKDALHAEDAHRKKQLQRQVQLEEENAALKLRMEGQRRAIHELEHQAKTLREEARIREEELLRLQRKLTNAASSVARGECSCCASTHHSRVRGVGDSGASALRKRALVAEARAQTLERRLTDNKGQGQRNREIVASLKHSYSGAQDKVASLETELEFLKRTLVDAKHEVEESRRDVKMRVKDTRKHRRQQGERTREVEIARAKSADLAIQLRKASKEAERARVEAGSRCKEKTNAESQINNLVHENRLLHDRLGDKKLRSRVRERDRWILSELCSESASPTQRATRAPSRERKCPNEEQLPRYIDKEEASHTTPQQPLPARSSSNDALLRARVGGRRRRLGESPVYHPYSCPLPEAFSGVSGVPREDVESAGDQPRNGQPINRFHYVGGRTSRMPGVQIEAGNGLSTRSADGVSKDMGSGVVLERSVLSAGSAHSNMGARYERLQAMYRRVNRRDAGVRGRAGVG